MPKTIVAGLDGANYELVEKYVDEGELPNLGRILATGTTGELESVLPPVTSPNWKAYSTGKNPGKLGIFWWLNVDTENGRVYLPSDRYHEQTEFWERMGETEPIGILGMPTTFPPKNTGLRWKSGRKRGPAKSARSVATQTERHGIKTRSPAGVGSRGTPTLQPQKRS